MTALADVRYRSGPLTITRLRADDRTYCPRPGDIRANSGHRHGDDSLL